MRKEIVLILYAVYAKKHIKLFGCPGAKKIKDWVRFEKECYPKSNLSYYLDTVEEYIL